MCGIAGFYSHKYTRTQLCNMTDSIAHRGPNAAGYFFDEANGIGLGHRRLSIIDLSSSANQPMISHCGRYTMIYNGEVYNFKEIKRDKFNDFPWKTSGDSEVLLESFAKYGVDCFEWFNGMFAIAIWDKEQEVLTIARDQIGIKPLFLFHDGKDIAFASELKALKRLIPNLSVNKEAIPYFLHLGYIPHPITIYNNVHKLSAGSYIQYKKGQAAAQEVSFWSISQKIKGTQLSDPTEAKKQLKELLIDSVEKQLVSDVPIGTFLSGGIDSSIVTAVASSVSKTKINTFSIAVTDGKINEAPYAKAVAEHLGTNHHELPIKQSDISELVPSLMDTYDEPYADSSAFPTMLVSKLARQHVTVALSGDGGDELFFGYGVYTWADRLSNPIFRTQAPLFYKIAQVLPGKFKGAARFFDYKPPQNFRSHLVSQDHHFFSQNELAQILKFPYTAFGSINDIETDSRKLTGAEKQSFWDMSNYLKDDLLVKVDRASMKYSLETRVPLLDMRLIEFSLNLDNSLKRNGNISKYLLKEVLYDYLPKQLFDRPKWGFGVPLENWLKTDLKYLLDKYTSKSMVEKHNIFNSDYITKMTEDFIKGKPNLYHRVWVVITLHWFLDESNK